MTRVKKLHLPFPAGPHATGCMELMTEYSSEGCFSRIFYPTNIPPNELEKKSDKWVPWIPHEMYMKAFSKILHAPYFLFKHAPPLIGQGPYFIPTVSDAPLSENENSYPLIIFSHGFGAARFVCSDLYNSLASYGFIVAAIEHRDESAVLSFYYDSPENAAKDKRTWIHQRQFEKTDNDSDHYNLRNNQLKIRHKECIKLLNTILEINKGISVKNVLESSFDLKLFKNRIDVNNIVSMGFSFGGATAMYNAANDKRFRTSIIIDGWMFPIKSEPLLNIDHPMLFINSHTFHIPPNLKVLRKYIESDGNRRVVTLKKTTHESHTDTALIHGYWLDKLMFRKMNAKTALILQSSIAVKFLAETIGYPKHIENVEKFIEEHRDKVVNDVISYTVKPKRSLAVYPWSE